MESLIRFTLVIAAALYLGWGLALVLATDVAHGLISVGSYDPVTTVMFGAGLISMMIMFLIAAYVPERGIVRAAAAGLTVIGFTAVYLMFVAAAMPVSLVTVFSLLADVAAGAVLFVAEARLDLRQQPKARRTAPVARPRHA